MKKRFLALALALVMMISLLPTAFAAGNDTIHTHGHKAETAAAPEGTIRSADEQEISAEAYESADALYALIDEMEAAPEKKNASRSELSQAAEKLVLASEGYVKGSLERKGNTFTWWTEDGIHCIYDPHMREKQAQMVAGEVPAAPKQPVVTETKGGSPSGREVYLIGPYYGIDDNFSDWYSNLANDIAASIGDTNGYTLYSAGNATVDTVATAMSNGAVVLFDSHGSTDYSNPNDYDDYVSGATNSYLCLTTSTGMTNADYYDGALYGSGYAYINGETISNHMTYDSPSGILWMGICLGMATNTLCEPLRGRGVEVVYGYSQSVTFGGDICWSGAFWESLCTGVTVADAITSMKSIYGSWDCSSEICNACGWSGACTSVSQARAERMAFPIVVSDEDPYPGKGTVDGIQTVCSTYNLFGNETCGHLNTSTNTVPATCTTDGYIQIICNDCGRVIGVSVLPATGHSYNNGYCIYCGAARDTNFYLVESSSQLKDGEYVLLAESWGAYSTSPYYAVCNYLDSNYTALNTVATDFTSVPTSISAGDAFVWEVSVGDGNITLKSLNGQYLHDTSSSSGVSVNFSPYSAAWGINFYYDSSVSLESGSDVYLSMRDDLSATGDNGCPVVAISYDLSTGGESGSGYFYLYRRDKASCVCDRFNDVSTSDWFHSAVDYALINGLFNGTSANTFEPDTPMSRAMMVTVLWRYAGQPSAGSSGFADVPDGQWYSEAIAWAAENGVVTGVGNNRFDPDGLITREQLAAILFRYTNSIGQSTSVRGDLTVFPDNGAVSNWAYEAMSWAVGEGLVTGNAYAHGAYLDPQYSATRAQVATIMMRYIEN